jgi:hypothetical protein
MAEVGSEIKPKVESGLSEEVAKSWLPDYRSRLYNIVKLNAYHERSAEIISKNGYYKWTIAGKDGYFYKKGDPVLVVIEDDFKDKIQRKIRIDNSSLLVDLSLLGTNKKKFFVNNERALDVANEVMSHLAGNVRRKAK